MILVALVFLIAMMGLPLYWALFKVRGWKRPIFVTGILWFFLGDQICGAVAIAHARNSDKCGLEVYERVSGVEGVMIAGFARGRHLESMIESKGLKFIEAPRSENSGASTFIERDASGNFSYGQRQPVSRYREIEEEYQDTFLWSPIISTQIYQLVDVRTGRQLARTTYVGWSHPSSYFVFMPNICTSYSSVLEAVN